VGYATMNDATMNVCYNEHGGILMADVAHTCALHVGPSPFD